MTTIELINLYIILVIEVVVEGKRKFFIDDDWPRSLQFVPENLVPFSVRTTLRPFVTAQPLFSRKSLCAVQSLGIPYTNE